MTAALPPAADMLPSLSASIQVLLLLSALTVLPAAVLMMTSFTRIIVVLAILRQALGLGQSPPNQLLVGLALLMTLFVMRPTLDTVVETAYRPLMAGTIPAETALGRGGDAFKTFMLAQTRRRDLERFVALSGAGPFARPADVPVTIVVPAFAASELKTALQIGFIIYLPFLVIDLVVASVLMAMGMMMVSPMTVSLPVKLALFISIDGWTLVMGSLARSFTA